MYPGYAGDLDVEGKVSLNLFDDGVVIHYDMTGVDAACASGPTSGDMTKKKNLRCFCYLCIFFRQQFLWIPFSFWR